MVQSWLVGAHRQNLPLVVGGGGVGRLAAPLLH